MFLQSMHQNKVDAMWDCECVGLRACGAGAGMSWVEAAWMWRMMGPAAIWL